MLGAIALSMATLTPLINQSAKGHRVAPALIKAHMRVESNFNPNAYRPEPAINDTSWGLMQILLSTARETAKSPSLIVSDLLKPDINIEIGTMYIAKQLARYKGNIKDAIAAYNAGSAIKNEEGIYTNSIGDTKVQDYVNKVYAWYIAYKGLEIVEQPAGLATILGIGLLSSYIFMSRK